MVDILPPDKSFHYFKVVAGNGYMILKNNQPVLNRHKLKHRRPDWTVETGDIWNKRFKELIIEAIENNINNEQPGA